MHSFVFLLLLLLLILLLLLLLLIAIVCIVFCSHWPRNINRWGVASISMIVISVQPSYPKGAETTSSWMTSEAT